MEAKQKKILIVAALVVIVIVVYLFVSKKNDDAQGDAVADAMQQAADKVAQAAQANSDTARQIEENKSTVSQRKFLTAGMKPNVGETVYLAANTADSLDIRNNNARKNIDYKLKNDNAEGLDIGTYEGTAGSLYWKMHPSSSIKRKSKYLIKYGFYTKAGNYLYVLR